MIEQNSPQPVVARRVLHWFDFICPFCYVGQQRTEMLRRRGLDPVELPFQAHPEIPVGGIPAGPRIGSMYEMLEREAREAGLPLNWPARLPNTRLALAAAEWTRRNYPGAFKRLQMELFAAHFARGESLEDRSVINRYAAESGVDLAALGGALNDGSALAAVSGAETLGRKYGVHGTPSWLVGERLIVGLVPAGNFDRLVESGLSIARDRASHRELGFDNIREALIIRSGEA